MRTKTKQENLKNKIIGKIENKKDVKPKSIFALIKSWIIQAKQLICETYKMTCNNNNIC